MRHVVFPLTGVVSLFSCSAEGGVLEVGLVSHEGLVGGSVAIGATTAQQRAVVQSGGHALRIDAPRFRGAVGHCPTLVARIHRFQHFMADQFAVAAICHRLHTVEGRSAGRMLSIGDRTGSDTFKLTQSVLATMIGALRPAVSRAASTLAQQGLVAYSRGLVRIVDRPGLEAAACSCYQRSAKRYRLGLKWQ
jgi:CRP-like cAMP-binding protein